jgi:2-dehydro-3-deoxygluconokinase
MKTVFLGELLLRLEPNGYERLLQAESFHVRYTGAEVNAGVSLANYGGEAWAVSAVPDDEIGQACVNCVRRYGVHTDHILRRPGRLGLFFLETGASQRPSKVIYDRANSCMALAEASDFDFDKICEGKDWLHFSGTMPALSSNSAQVTEVALAAAKRHGLIVSCDLNFRKRLWTAEKAQSTMRKLMRHVDILIGNEEDAANSLGMAPKGVDVTKADYSTEPYRELCASIRDLFDLKYVVMTFRKSLSASVNKWSAGIFDGTCFLRSREYTMNVVDRVGGGDSFSGALIFALQDGLQPDKAIEFAVAASCLKHSIPGDFNLSSKEEVFSLMGGDESGRVQR